MRWQEQYHKGQRVEVQLTFADGPRWVLGSVWRHSTSRREVLVLVRQLVRPRTEPSLREFLFTITRKTEIRPTKGDPR